MNAIALNYWWNLSSHVCVYSRKWIIIIILLHVSSVIVLWIIVHAELCSIIPTCIKLWVIVRFALNDLLHAHLTKTSSTHWVNIPDCLLFELLCTPQVSGRCLNLILIVLKETFLCLILNHRLVLLWEELVNWRYAYIARHLCDVHFTLLVVLTDDIYWFV